MPTPFPSPQEAQDHAVFRSLLKAMSRPGVGCPLPHEGMAALQAIGQALLDLETRFYTPDPHLQQQFLRLGARAAGPAGADFLFFPEADERIRADLEQAPIGSLLHPEAGATVVVLTRSLPGARLRLSGPGLAEPAVLETGLPKGFWQLRNERVSFPLGWDVLLVEPQGVCRAVPRSTTVEVA